MPRETRLPSCFSPTYLCSKKTNMQTAMTNNARSFPTYSPKFSVHWYSSNMNTHVNNYIYSTVWRYNSQLLNMQERKSTLLTITPLKLLGADTMPQRATISTTPKGVPVTKRALHSMAKGTGQDLLTRMMGALPQHSSNMAQTYTTPPTKYPAIGACTPGIESVANLRHSPS